jgi:formate-dependent nitrite reductase cytochrome c552 subunit
MGRKRNMPSRVKIFEYWKNEFKVKNDNTCFKCGITSVFGDTIIVERAHILAVCDGGSDDVSNIHLLCKDCHRQSEAYDGDIYKLWLCSKNKEEFGKSLFVLWNKDDIKNKRLDRYFNKIKSDFINNTSKSMLDFQLRVYEIESEQHLKLYYKFISKQKSIKMK